MAKCSLIQCKPSWGIERKQFNNLDFSGITYSAKNNWRSVCVNVCKQWETPRLDRFFATEVSLLLWFLLPCTFCFQLVQYIDIYYFSLLGELNIFRTAATVWCLNQYDASYNCIHLCIEQGCLKQLNRPYSLAQSSLDMKRIVGSGRALRSLVH